MLPTSPEGANSLMGPRSTTDVVKLPTVAYDAVMSNRLINRTPIFTDFALL